MILINTSTQITKGILEAFTPRGIPLGLASLYAVLKQNGKDPHLFDEQMIGDSLIHIRNKFCDHHVPYIFGISVLTASYDRSLKLASALKLQYPNSTIVFGGVHPSAVPEEVLANEQVDLVAQGEMEGQIVDIEEAITANKPLDDIPNLCYRSNGTVVHTEQRPIRVDLNVLPCLPYELFTDPRYRLGVVVSSRGCPYHCIFCSNRVITERQYRFKKASIMADEIELLYNQYDQRNIAFVDDNFLVNKERIYALLDELEKRHLIGKIEYSCQGRADNTDEAVLKALYAHGFRHIAFGIETGSERVMKVIQKGETVRACYEAVRLARRVGFHVSGTFIFGLPTETHDDRMESVRFVKRTGMDEVRFNNATPYPGTKLYEMAKEDGGLRVVGRYENLISQSATIDSPFSSIPFSYVPPGTTEKEIRNDIFFAYLCVYLNARKLWNALFRGSGGKRRSDPRNTVFARIVRLSNLGILVAALVAKFFDLVVHFILGRECAVTRQDLGLCHLKEDG